MTHQQVMRARLSSLTRLMRERGCSHLLVSDAISARYITGFRSSNVYLLISRGSHALCTDFRYEQAAREFCAREGRWRPHIISESDFSFLASLVPPGSTLGFESAVVTVDQLARIRKALPQVRTIALGAAVDEVSVVKSTTEVAAMTRAARIGAMALRRTLASLTVGVTESRVRDILEEHCRALGSECPAFDTIVLFGRRSALPHGVPGPTRLRDGDFVLFDFGCTIDGLKSDMTRTFVKGKASPEHRKIYQTVLSAQRACARAIRGGMRACDADRLARAIIEKAGYGAAFGHATGHGVGYRIHEGPRVSSRNRNRLLAGSVVTVEPGIYIESTGGVRIEDMVVLTPQGCHILTPFPRMLMEL